MNNFEDLARKLIAGEEVTLSYERYNDGTEEEPDITIDHVYATIEDCKIASVTYKDIVVYVSKENDDTVGDTTEIYRMPFIEDLRIVACLLEASTKQAHS